MISDFNLRSWIRACISKSQLSNSFRSQFWDFKWVSVRDLKIWNLRWEIEVRRWKVELTTRQRDDRTTGVQWSVICSRWSVWGGGGSDQWEVRGGGWRAEIRNSIFGFPHLISAARQSRSWAWARVRARGRWINLAWRRFSGINNIVWRRIRDRCGTIEDCRRVIQLVANARWARLMVFLLFWFLQCSRALAARRS